MLISQKINDIPNARIYNAVFIFLDYKSIAIFISLSITIFVTWSAQSISLLSYFVVYDFIIPCLTYYYSQCIHFCSS